MSDKYCWVTGELILEGAPCRFTFEWDAWVSEEGQRCVWACNESDDELVLIRNEWVDEDAHIANLMEQLGEDSC